MTFFATLFGFFNFFDELYQLVQHLQATPAEKHAEVMAKVKETFDETNATHPNRPDWS